jgi:hypothetical protein
LSPFAQAELLEPRNSLALLRDGEVVGWMINHRIDDHTVRYTRLFVVDELQGSGLGMLLAFSSAAIHLRTEMRTDTPTMLWIWPLDSPAAAYAQRWERRYAIEVSGLFRSLKVLSRSAEVKTQPARLRTSGGAASWSGSAERLARPGCLPAVPGVET